MSNKGGADADAGCLSCGYSPMFSETRSCVDARKRDVSTYVASHRVASRWFALRALAGGRRSDGTVVPLLMSFALEYSTLSAMTTFFSLLSP